LKSKPSKEPASRKEALFDPEDESSTFLRISGIASQKADKSVGYCKIGTLFMRLRAVKLRNFPFRQFI
jgi:hypothetical protein